MTDITVLTYILSQIILDPNFNRISQKISRKESIVNKSNELLSG